MGSRDVTHGIDGRQEGQADPQRGDQNRRGSEGVGSEERHVGDGQEQERPHQFGQVLVDRHGAPSR